VFHVAVRVPETVLQHTLLKCHTKAHDKNGTVGERGYYPNARALAFRRGHWQSQHRRCRRCSAREDDEKGDCRVGGWGSGVVEIEKESAVFNFDAYHCSTRWCPRE
jgi:hypothetical protein